MPQENAESSHMVVIVGIRDEGFQAQVARAVAQVAKNASLEQIEKRIKTLPWTLTKSADRNTAARLVKLLEEAGAVVRVDPPLEAPALGRMDQKEVGRVPREGVERPAPQPIVPGTGPKAVVGRSYEEASVASPGALEIGPLTLGGILDRTFQICKSHFWKLIGILVIPWLVIALLSMMVALGVGMFWLAGSLTGAGKEFSWVLIIPLLGALVAVVLGAVAVFYLSQGALIYAVSAIHLGRPFQVFASYRLVLDKLVRFIFTSMLCALFVMLLIFVPILVGVVLFFVSQGLLGSGWWSALTWIPLAVIPTYAIPKLLLFDKVVVLEDEAYYQALKRSWNLMTGKADSSWPAGYWLRFVILMHLFVLINIAISVLFTVPATIIQLLVPESLTTVTKVVSQVISNLGGLIAGLFGSVGVVVFYYDIRNRKEGFDLSMLAAVNEPKL
ncbi:MAG: hypothetical protein FJ118_10045 [Deltaproteobacteria bacterium]|nr:hypothetical protein [Deltaproteobacteria bacterium]